MLAQYDRAAGLYSQAIDLVESEDTTDPMLTIFVQNWREKRTYLLELDKQPIKERVLDFANEF